MSDAMMVDPDAPCQHGGAHAYHRLHRLRQPHSRIVNWIAGIVVSCLWCGADRPGSRSWFVLP